ncbi:MAG: DoxX family protein [Patescibacteria group bacterium]
MPTKITSKEIAPIILRIAMSLVFLWFGSQQLIHPSNWLSFVPDSVVSFSHLSATILVHFNGAFEIVFGLALLFGFFTRTSALLLGLHLFNITLSLGLSAIAVRDFGLSMATLAIVFYGMDRFCLDYRMS